MANPEAWNIMSLKRYCTREWLHHNHDRQIPRTLGSVLSEQEILETKIQNYIPAHPYNVPTSDPDTANLTHVVSWSYSTSKWLPPIHIWHTPRPVGSVVHCLPIVWNHLLVQTFCLRAGRNLLKCQEGLWKYMKNRSQPPDKVIWSTIKFTQGHSVSFLVSVDFPSCSKGSLAHLCWSCSDVGQGCRQITDSNQSDNHANQHPACNYWKYCSVFRSQAFSEEKLLQYHKYCIETLCCICKSSSPNQDLHGIYWRWSHQKWPSHYACL